MLKTTTLLLLLFLSALALAQTNKLGPCEDCELMLEGMPAKLNWETKLATPSEGEEMLISGVIYQKDGKTPAPNVILYVYHTDKNGQYTPGPDQKHARRHGHMRGWMKTDARGRYEFKSIRPAAYPGRKDPAHIHPIIQEPDGRFYWIDEYLFEDDPLVTAQVRAQQDKRGGNGIIALKKNQQGTWEGRRDIVLGLNVEGY
jgi:protocatechuate 3,4-dioxygenase, beta subunit